MATCANPACDTEVLIGVCIRCANSAYVPTKHGIDYAGITTGEGYER